MADTIGTILSIVIPLFGAMFWAGRQLGKRIDDCRWNRSPARHR